MPDGPTTPFVINRYRRPNQNLRQTLLRILRAAGVQPWPRLFQNMRASRETELLAQWPAKDVSSWLGNSTPVAMKHYAMATDAAFKAASSPEGQTVMRTNNEKTGASGSSCGSISSVSGVIEPTIQETADADSPGEIRHYIVQDSAGGYYLVGLAAPSVAVPVPPQRDRLW
jgi:hypothetical protein